MPSRSFIYDCRVAVWGQDAASLCKKVADRYKGLDGFHIEGAYELASRRMNTPGASAGTSAKFTIDAAERGLKRRVEYKSSDFSMTLITDGSTIWTYLPGQKTYTRIEAGNQRGRKRRRNGLPGYSVDCRQLIHVACGALQSIG